MGLRINIGQRERTEEGWEGVRYESHPLAPALPGDEANHRQNSRTISIGVAETFFTEAGLTAWNSLPDGVYPLHEPFLEQAREATYHYRRMHPGAVAGWNEGQDETLGRLEWLEWWMYYALSRYHQTAAIEFSS